MVYRRVDQVDAAQHIVGVIETTDEMAQPLGRASRKMKNIIELMFAKQ
jgi:hypothetical protein